MLDAAVASEAYRPSLHADSADIIDKYVPSDWDGYPARSWAANWYTWFTNKPSDARAELGEDKAQILYGHAQRIAQSLKYGLGLDRTRPLPIHPGP